MKVKEANTSSIPVLKVKNGTIMRANGTIMGSPKTSRRIYRSNNTTGSVDCEGNVYDKKGIIIGRVDISLFPQLSTKKEGQVKDSKVTKKTLKISKNTCKTTKISKASVRSNTKAKAKTQPSPKVSEPKMVSSSPNRPLITHADPLAPGLNSADIVSGRFTKMYVKPQPKPIDQRLLEQANKSYGWNYSSWRDLSEKEDLSDEFLMEYSEYVDWYIYLYNHPDREFNRQMMNRFAKKLVLRALDIVPHTQYTPITFDPKKGRYKVID